uniref:Uncharacterized protein n=2 Tax=unclassified Candidatus Kentrum TaxID=2643149 RepID=A0A451AXA7_9GAMM|nr:MAG: hypothetical protein BECKLPF1236B_GA0070989_13933 [Candidatus Kentron sp. LPFa]VFK62993.1 MAG: hypothetical protein BECKUNK1418G_GA0071005_102840 [Candidatus Kentron sp. UNK]VFK70690.1 MAG: hypothetical protein BECKUNK1418H_GA0071006_103540 [Candidatus Kentron sp. UNK]
MQTAEILFDTFIKKIIDDGVVTSEEEAEQAVFSMLSERELDRKIAIAREQVRNGQYTEMNDGFVEDFLKEAEARNAHIFKDDGEHVSASRQDPNGVFLARAPVLSEILFFRNFKKIQGELLRCGKGRSA